VQDNGALEPSVRDEPGDYTDIKGPMPRARLDPRKANLRDRDLRLKMFTKLRVQLPTVS
jgi:hypothetical protein